MGVGHDSSRRNRSMPSIKTGTINYGKRAKNNQVRLMPDTNFQSAACKRNECCECASLRCSHSCHKGNIK